MSEREPNLSCFIDYENVALGAKDESLAFDIERVLTRLHEKGKLLVKRAYCDWSRYESAKKPLHAAGFELVEVPHISYSGKNSADIRMAVDVIDLCHTKPHLDGFVIVSGDSDFSPLVSKLRENDKHVVGVGVKSSTSKLLVANCDEFVFYDDLVPDQRPEGASGDPAEALELVTTTAEALLRDRGDPVWGSHIKQVLKRKQPHFNESWFGFRSFNDVLEAARDQGHLEMRKDEPSGGYVVHQVH
ncbi:MAG: NYN domain-containing protein [Deltaproteobacteria bacterium]|nr:MAG: NYN domain-containing protein [Deltaproteobacteria bacterium]